MSDKRHQRTAREEAIAHIQAVRDFWWPTPTTPGMELDDIPSDLLRRLADERCMAASTQLAAYRNVEDKEPDDIRVVGTFDRISGVVILPEVKADPNSLPPSAAIRHPKGGGRS